MNVTVYQFNGRQVVGYLGVPMERKGGGIKRMWNGRIRRFSCETR